MPDQSTFQRFVQVGRVVLLKTGPYQSKIAVIVEIVDHRRAIIDGPTTGVPRQPFPYRHLILTPISMKKLPRGARTGVVKKYIEKEEIVKKWNSSAWAQKLDRTKQRRSVNDFQRFSVQLMKKNRRDRVRRALAKESKA